MSNSSGSYGPLINRNTDAKSRCEPYGVAQTDRPFSVVLSDTGQLEGYYARKGNSRQLFKYFDAKHGGFRTTKYVDPKQALKKISL